MSARTSRVKIPSDIRGAWYAHLGTLHLSDALEDGRKYARPLDDEVVRVGREKRDRRIIAEAREAQARASEARTRRRERDASA